MHLVIDVFTLAAYLCVLPYFVFLLVISVAALLRQRGLSESRCQRPASAQPRKRFLVVVPAHDEEAGIDATIASCRALHYPPELFDVLVVADNCSDQTAARARQAGARVLERNDPEKKSKGYAIEYLIESLLQSGEFDALDAIVVVDADSTAHENLLDRFAQALEGGFDWIQCYDSVSNSEHCWRTQLLAYGFSLINGVALLGQRALGLSAALRGNGMCLSTRALRSVPWRTHGLAEDLEYSWMVRISGGQIAFAGDVAVYATMPTRGGKGAAAQRHRWEHGRSELKWRMLGPLVQSTCLGWSQKIASLLELTMPTAVVLFCTYLLLTFLAIVRLPYLYSHQGNSFFHLIVFFHAIATVGLLVYAASPFIMSLIPVRFARSLFYIPYYALWKMTVRLRGRPNAWVRTARELRHGTPRRASH
jgi:cellulose synthase/poly-beta-1,6-N-acetylglucosamine synthase-like glycosyltransferase